MTRVGALVVGGDYRGLGIVRSLGRHGITVWVAQSDDKLAGASRYAERRLPWPEESEEEEIRYLLDLADNSGLRGWVLFPTSDRTASLVSRNHHLLRTRYRLTTSPWGAYSIAQDKRRSYIRAEALGIGVPRTWETHCIADVEALDLDFPVILKPAAGTAHNAFTVAKAWRVDDRDSLLARYAEAQELLPAGLILVQDLIPGGGDRQLSFACVCRHGEVLASLTARRTRQIPADFGRASSFVETIERGDVVEPATKLIRDLDLDGLVEIEFKEDPRDGQLKLLDINARAWGWHSIGAAAGVDFSYLAWRAAQDLDVAFAHAHAGVRWVRLTMDVPVSAREILAGRASLRGYLRTLRPPVEGAIAASDDMWPALAELPLLAWRTLQRVSRTKSGSRGECGMPSEADGTTTALLGSAEIGRDRNEW